MPGPRVRLTQLLQDAWRNAISIAQAKGPDVALAFVEREFGRDVIEFDSRTRSRARRLIPTFVAAAKKRNWARFPRPAGRLPFLAAARSFLRKKENEWVVIGLGVWRGHRSTVHEVSAWEGHTSTATLPDSASTEAAGHLGAGERSELLHVHNHPSGLRRTIKNLLVGEAPVPSSADRIERFRHAEFVAEANARGGVRRARFYLVENGQVHEYTLPPWPVLRPVVAELLKTLRRG